MVESWYEEVTVFNRKEVSAFKYVILRNSLESLETCIVFRISFSKNCFSFLRDDVNDDGEDIGHYTQLVWATTDKIGCGLTQYRDEDGDLVNNLVCNYGEGGNVSGKPIYKTG